MTSNEGAPTTYVPRGPRMSVSVTSSEDLLREARAVTADLSVTVEQLLAEYVAAEHRKREERERLIDETVEMAKMHYAKHGLWGEEFSTL